MHKSLGDIIEIVILMLFLATGTTLGIKSLYDVYRETCQYSLELEDKNAATKISDVISTGDYDTLLSPGEICLMSQIQDFGMPKPNSLMSGGEELKIDTSRCDNTSSYIAKLNTMLNNQYSYLVRFDYKTNSYYCTPYLKTRDSSHTIRYTNKEKIRQLDPTFAYTNPNITRNGKIFEIREGTTAQALGFSNVLQNGKTYLITFRAFSTVANDDLHIDAFPDDLPEMNYALSTTPTTYSWLVTIPGTDTGKSSVQYLRLFVSGITNKGKITISNIELIEY